MQRWMKIAISLPVISILSACFATEGNIYQDWRDGYYSPNLVRFVSRDGSMATALVGQPFKADGQSAKSDPELLTGLMLPAYFGNLPLRPVKSKNPSGGRLVLLFDPDKPTSSEHICDGAPLITRASSKTMEVQAVFCFDDHLVSEASMKMPRPSGPKSEAYRRNMGNLITILLPTRGPYSGDCPSKGGC